MKDRHLLFLVFAVGFLGVMITISFVGRDSLDKILLNLYGWTILVTAATAVYYGVLFFRDRHSKDIWQVEESKESRKILKIAIVILLALFVIPILINFVFGLQSPFYFNQT